MSTSLSAASGSCRVLDPPDMIRRKVRSAVTDSGRDVVRAEDKPGVTNLIEIMAVATGDAPEAIEARYDGAGYGRFKEEVAEAVVELLDPIRLRYGELRGDPRELARHSREGRRQGARDRGRDARSARTSASASSLPEPCTSPRTDPISATYPGIRRRLAGGRDRLGALLGRVPHRLDRRGNRPGRRLSRAWTRGRRRRPLGSR